MNTRLTAVLVACSLVLALVFALGQTNPVSASRRPPPTPTPTSQPLTIITSGLYPCTNGVCAMGPGTVGTDFYEGATTNGTGKGPTPYTWSVVAGSLPAGLSLTPNGAYAALVSGTPTTTQTSTFTLQVRDGAGDTARQAFTLTINPPPSLFVDTASEGYNCANGVCTFPPGNVGTQYDAPITSGGGRGPTPYTWSVVAGSLPAGLSLTPSYGVYSAYIYGMPTTLQTSTFTLQVRDGAGDTARQAFTLTINPVPPLVITSPSPCCAAGSAGTPYMQNVFANGGIQPYTWSIASGQLPPGLSLDCPTPPASFDGVPTTAGTFTFTLKVTDAQGSTATAPGSITIQPSSATPASLSVAPTCVHGGTSSTGTVRLSGPAPAGGTVVTLLSNNAAAIVPSSVTIPAGAVSASFSVSTKPVSSYTSVSLIALIGGQDLFAELAVRPS